MVSDALVSLDQTHGDPKIAGRSDGSAYKTLAERYSCK